MEHILRDELIQIIRNLYDPNTDEKLVQLQETRKEFVGDFTLVVFPLLRLSRKSPEETAKEIGEAVVDKLPMVQSFQVEKGFLNMLLSDEAWLEFFQTKIRNQSFGIKTPAKDAPVVLVEYSSPNTNKPLHLGHVRNNLLGYALSNILEATGKKVIKTSIINDRGIHICKSMAAYLTEGKNDHPESAGKKGDHLVGDYYVAFNALHKQQIAELKAKGLDEKVAAEEAEIMKQARELLRKWEQGDAETLTLWKKMNQWVLSGFNETYAALGVSFDQEYFESETYKLGKKLVEEALEKEILYRKEDGSVWADLSDRKLDQKILLRSDGTAVYMTQDLGTAVLRYEDHHFEETIFVVGNEQLYHFQVLQVLLDKMGYSWAGGLKHFSYGMVELPEGKMKSREGTVVDADDLMEEMKTTAAEMAEELGKLEGAEEKEKEEIIRKIGLGALKYFMLKVDPRKNMTFNPRESIDFNGNTGPFIQYTYARIQSLKRKAEGDGIAPGGEAKTSTVSLNERERDLLRRIYRFPQILAEASENLSPALIANFVYELVKSFNQFYHDYSVLNEENADQRDFRLQLSLLAGELIEKAMGLLGIEMPERM